MGSDTRRISRAEGETPVRGIGLDCGQLNDGAAVAPFTHDTGGVFGPNIETEELAVSTGVARMTAQGGANRCWGQMSDVDRHSNRNLRGPEEPLQQ
jgi:hypothetical protein